MHSGTMPSGRQYFYDGDYSGEIIIKVDPSKDIDGDNVSIDFEDLKAIVANALVKEKISKLEQMTPDEILKL